MIINKKVALISAILLLITIFIIIFINKNKTEDTFQVLKVWWKEISNSFLTDVSYKESEKIISKKIKSWEKQFIYEEKINNDWKINISINFQGQTYEGEKEILQGVIKKTESWEYDFLYNKKEVTWNGLVEENWDFQLQYKEEKKQISIKFADEIIYTDWISRYKITEKDLESLISDSQIEVLFSVVFRWSIKIYVRYEMIEKKTKNITLWWSEVSPWNLSELYQKEYDSIMQEGWEVWTKLIELDKKYNRLLNR